jgi:DNA-binding beta-propeller fold protein YncE
MKVLIAIVAALLVLLGVAAGGAGANGSRYSPGLMHGWSGVRSPDGMLRYVTIDSPKESVVAVIRTDGGKLLRSRPLGQFYGVPLVAFDGTPGGVSGNGKLLVLGSYGPQPGEAGTTRFVALKTRTLSVWRKIELPGAWSFDAVSPDGSRVYLTEHLSAGPSPRYRVRQYDLRARQLLPQSVIDKAASAATMRGQPATRAMSPGGRWAYTLYARPKHAPFVHALDTSQQRAYCVDLPLRLDQSQQMGLRLALRDGGRHLFVRYSGAAVAVMDTKSLTAKEVGS